MLADLIAVLACPWCGGGDLSATRPIPRSGRIVDGGLSCAACDRVTEIRGGIWHAMGPHRVHRTLAQLSNVVPPVPHLYERLWRRRSLSLLSRTDFSIEMELALLVDAMQPGVGRVMVDSACSEGLYARALAGRGSPVIAIDHSLPFLRRTALRAAHLPVAPVRALAQHLPIRDQSLAGSVMGGSLNEIGDQRMALRELVRVLRSGENAWVMSLTPARTTRGRLAQLAAKPSGISFPTAADVERWLEPATVRSRQELGVVSMVVAQR
jgi:SAM-dependent methyltransferase